MIKKVLLYILPVLMLSLFVYPVNAVYQWSQASAPALSWVDIASSSDGLKVVAASQNGLIYTSINGGMNWTAQTNSGSRTWTGVASSSDGTKLAASVFFGGIYTSTDSGVTWTLRSNAGSQAWSKIVSSADGTVLLAFDQNNGRFRRSGDSGVNWATLFNAPGFSWGREAFDISDDGQTIIAAHKPGSIYRSTDSGASWSEITSAGSRDWFTLSCNSDCSTILAVDNSSSTGVAGYVYLSQDSGATWTEQTSLGLLNWYAAEVPRNNPSILLAGGGNTPRLVSLYEDGAWGNELDVFDAQSTKLTSSADGTRLYAATAYSNTSNNRIFIAQYLSPTPTPSPTPTATPTPTPTATPVPTAVPTATPSTPVPTVKALRSSAQQSPSHCLQHYTHCVDIGPNAPPKTEFISGIGETSELQVYIPREATPHDLHIVFSKVDLLDMFRDPTKIVPFPWMQGLNTAGDIYTIIPVSAFNGYPVVDITLPGIVIVPFDPEILVTRTISVDDLRIAIFNSQSHKWEVLEDNTVINWEEHTLANITERYGHFAVVYTR